ncbi:MAG: hypothetical protein B7Y25_08280 [Alphaproteobacteria bacterium 16-39-46]|nr:MAG: hypothetical protein B7Y25_08280 [Alphaproteobacteria bacterium 16-39-46]OZA41203.1 MAG: hypothetical protein B7X84_08380 [Alphaproteobacteria bacterium 17-39-52]HQS84664.1 HU family DNA-binding protein [Alphaproteobacteria bacterium]HQS93121.1 HU family DNA-binding protein [Alphaproteobacteria bacterium]
MNKEDLITYVSKTVSLTKKEAEQSINAAFEGISEALKRGEGAAFVGFGSFAVHSRKARTGRNPRTGESIKIAASKAAKFRPGKNLKKL